MRVRIIQILCPQRHCIMATAYESQDGEPMPEIEQRLREKANDLVQAGGMNPWCGICMSRDWRYEDRQTPFKSMADALPVIRKIEAENAETRRFFRSSRR